MFRKFFLFVLFMASLAWAWDGVKFCVRARTNQRFFTGLYVGDKNVSWSPTRGHGTETTHEWGSDACGGRLVLFVGHERTEADSFAVPQDCDGKEYRFEVKEVGGALRLVRSTR